MLKRIISVICTIAMLFSVMCIGASAEGLYIDTHFKDWAELSDQFFAGCFYNTDEGFLYGFAEAKTLQSRYTKVDGGYIDGSYTWRTYDATVTLAIGDDDLSESDRWVNLVYRNDNLKCYGRSDETQYIAFSYDIQNGCFRITDGWNNTDPDCQLMDPVYTYIDTDYGEVFITLGISVERGRIRCFYNDQLVFDFVDSDDEYLIAKEKNSMFYLQQDGNFLQISNIKVADQGYIFSGTYAPITPTPDPYPTPNPTPGPVPEPGNAPALQSGKKVALSLVPRDVRPGDTKIYVDLWVTLPKGATGYELGCFGLDMNYDSRKMSLADDPEWHWKGTTPDNDDLSENPYFILWVSVKPREQYKAGSNHAATFTFDLNKPAVEGREYRFDLNIFDEEQGVYTMASKDGTYAEVKYSDDEIQLDSAVAEAKEIKIAFTAEPKAVREGDTTVTLDVCVTLPFYSDVYSLGSFGLELTYDPNVMIPDGEAEWMIGGNSMNSTGESPVPYRLLWVSIDPGDGSAPGKTVIARIVFKLNKAAEVGDNYTFGLSIDERNGVWTMPSDSGAIPAVPCDAIAEGTVVLVEADLLYGDANSDESVNLSDVTVVLQQIAKWENVNINIDAADVNVDGVINLSDVTLLLQYIAKWDGIVLGY